MAVVVAAVVLPYRVPTASDVTTPPPSTRPATAPAAVTFDALLDLNLRRPLVAPPATAPAVAGAIPLAPPPLRLAGIMSEPGHPFAVFVTPAGATEVRTVGQRAGDAEVLAISPTAVTVRSPVGATTTLRLPQAVPHP